MKTEKKGSNEKHPRQHGIPLFFFVPILIATEKKEKPKKKKNIKTRKPLKFRAKSNGKKEKEGDTLSRLFTVSFSAKRISRGLDI